MTRRSPNDLQNLVLSVVVVTYNESERIDDCLESIFVACEGLVTFEVILVDSNSSDETVDIASSYPISILRIPDDELTTPAAGRFVGTQAARGDYLLFVDGDMVVSRAWLECALEEIDEPGVAGVDGHLNEPAPHDNVEPVDSIRGVALYETDALERVGGFQPYLRSLEDVHLGFELTASGYELRRRPEVAGTHPERPPFSEPFRRWRQGYMIGTGQTIRNSASSPSLLLKHLYRIRHRLVLFGWLLLGLGTVVLWGVFGGRIVLFTSWVLTSLVAYGALTLKLGVKGGVSFLLAKCVGIAGLVRGLFVPTSARESYPLEEIEQLQYGPVHSRPSLTTQREQ